jgi:ribosomal protein L37AE/L43A
MRHFISLLLFFILISSENLAVAGQQHVVECDSKTCDFKDNIDFGGGFKFGVISGYCMECKQFIRITWRYSEREPTPIGHIWDSLNGKQQPIYACPKCSKPFSVIESAEDLIHCPKCQKASLKKFVIMDYD